MNLCGFFAKLCVITIASTFYFPKLHSQEIQMVHEFVDLKVIPYIMEPINYDGHFSVHSETKIICDEKFSAQANQLKNSIESVGDFEVSVAHSERKESLRGASDKSEIHFIINKDLKLRDGGYRLVIHSSEARLYAMDIRGIINGVQTLRQMIFLAHFHRPPQLSKSYSYIALKGVELRDEPKFYHRGMLLDCARHFFSVETVKKYIDLMALYKMNVLHWHLTEDQGWRIQIDKYPKLTEFGAWRTEVDGSKYGGFYTKNQIRDIVQFAQERGITIIPEIELPGHSQAAIASYPWLSCTGEQYEVINDWGVFKEIYCAGKDSTFMFLEDVLTEVMELFPSKYIHIGGDEAPKYRWEHCDRCQLRMKNEGLKDEHELQSYFIQRVEKFLQKNGRELIGWDEILEGGISKTATVQSWRGFEGGINAARQGNQVIMSPTSHCYFDYGLDAIDLEKVWYFDPYPEELEYQKRFNIIGAECNVWSEHIPDEATLDSKVFPRIMAMSEALWDYIRDDGYEGFYKRVQYHYPMLEHLGVKYGLETIPAKIESFVKDREIYARMKSSIPNVSYKIRWDEEAMELDGDYSEYMDLKEEVFKVEDRKLTAKVYKNGKQYGEPVEQFFTHHKALGAKVTYKNEYSPYYPAAGKEALVDGRTGIIEFRDGNWQGFWGKDLDVQIDLGEEKEVSTVLVMANEYQNSWIFRPKHMKVEISSDGENWKHLTVRSFPEPKPDNKKKRLAYFSQRLEQAEKARYIRVFLQNFGKVPEWHEAAGEDCWLFVDEIIVE